MNPAAQTYEQLTAEVAELRGRLDEASEILHAIRSGDVDAVLVQGPHGDQLFTLKGADEPYRVLIEEMNQGAVTLSAGGSILYCNRRFADLLKMPLEGIVGFAFDAFVAPSEQAAFAALLAAARTGGSAGEITLRAGDASAVPLQLALAPLPADSAAAICLVATDLSESREKEARLRAAMAGLVEAEQEAKAARADALLKTETLQSTIFSSANFSCIATDAKGVIQIFNVGAERMLGYTAADVINRFTPADLHDPQELIARAAALSLEFATPIAPGFEALVFKAARGLEGIYELTKVRKDGNRFPAIVSVTALRDAQDDLIGYLLIATDNTARDLVEKQHQKAEAARRASEARYSAIFENAPDGIVIANSESYYLDANTSMCRMLGYTRDELIGRHASNIVAPAEIPHIGPALGVIKARSEYHRDWQFQRKDGSIFTAEVIATEMPDGNLLGMIRDITERKTVQDTLDRERHLLRTLIDNLPASIYVKDLNGRLLIYNTASVRQVGLNSEAEALGRTVFDFFPPEIARLYEADDNLVLMSGRTITDREEPTQDCEGNRLLYLTTKLPLRDASGIIGLLGISQDITERKRTEQALRESEERFRFLNNLNEATRTLADPARIMAVMARMLGEHLRASRCAYADVEPDGELFTILHDYTDGCASTVGNYQLSLFGARAVTTLHSGQTLIIRNVEAELLPGEGADMFNAIGIKAIITCPLVKGGVLRAMMAVQQTTPRDWKPVEISIVQDVVERCWATIERRTAEEKIHQLNTELEQRVTERTAQLEAANEELEAFSYSVSHDLRAPLRGVDGYVRMLKEDCADRLDAEGNRLLDVVSSEAKRMGRLIDDLLAFSRLGREQMDSTAIDMTALARAAFESPTRTALESAPRFDLKSLPLAQGDLSMLRQVFVNLIGNAVKFTRHQPAPVVEVGARSGDGETTYYVKDNGVGFDEKYAHKLFGVFQRLHSETEFEGTGVGLALVQRVIHRHGGKVWAEGKPNQGATFFFTLPLRKEPANDPSH